MNALFNRYFIKRSFPAIFLLILFFGCATEKGSVKKNTSTPGKSSSLTSANYLTATGIGDSEKEARLNAKAELAAIFESKVSSEVINRVRSVVEASGKELVTRDDEGTIKVLSSVDLKGVEISKTWFDKKQGAYYAIAILDRARARDDWQKEIDTIDDKIDLIIQSLPSLKSDFNRYRSLKKARQLWMKKEVTQSRLRVLGYSDSSMADYDIKDILSKIEYLKSQFLIYIAVDSVNSKYASIISSEISENLSQAGYLISNEKGGASLLIEASIDVRPVELNNPDWEFARAILNLSIVDKASALTVGEISENKRSSHLTYEEAAHKAVKSVSNMCAQKIIEYFGSSE